MIFPQFAVVDFYIELQFLIFEIWFLITLLKSLIQEQKITSFIGMPIWQCQSGNVGMSI